MHARELLRRFGYRPKKRLGQHFLMDSAAAARIARLAVSGEHARVIEIGPGTGTLTRALLDCGADVTAIEIDPDMVELLRQRDDLANVTLVQADALNFDYARFGAAGPWALTGNLPYNIATALIVNFVQMHNAPEALTVMVQKDVADRLGARPGTRAYGSLSIIAQYAMEISGEFTLPPSVFFPKPKVHSAVVRLIRRTERAVRVTDEARFLQVVRGGFAYRRKTLANSLSLALEIPRAAITTTLSELGYNTEIRGEQLAIGDFARIGNALRSP